MKLYLDLALLLAGGLVTSYAEYKLKYNLVDLIHDKLAALKAKFAALKAKV